MTKRLIVLCAALWAAIFVLPLALVTQAEAPPVSLPPESGFSDEAPSGPAPTPTPEATPAAAPTVRDAEMTLTVRVSGEIQSMTLADYLLGVMCAEMPALYPEEALKAQAVAARTYCLYRMQSGAKFDGADMTDDSSVCMAYAAPAAMTASWGGESDAYLARMRACVEATDGEVMLDGAGKAIPALFFAISSGRTESAEDVWGAANPHLVSRESGWDEASPGFTGEVKIANTELVKTFTAAYPAASFPPGEVWFEDWQRSAAGGVRSVTVGGVAVTGKQMRSLFGLRSANFTVSFSDGVYTFTTRGYGHGVGMSQYGAKALAGQGKTYREILEAYYTDFTVGGIRRSA